MLLLGNTLYCKISHKRKNVIYFLVKMLLFVFCAILTTVSAWPKINIDTLNVVTVPPNCPAGQEWINGECRDVWRNILNTYKTIKYVPRIPF